MQSIDKFKEASKVIEKDILRTNLVHSEVFSKISKNNVYLKPENMQVTGSYKVRGALYKISTLTAEEKEKGIIAASAGNHAQGVALAAKKAGIDAYIVMPQPTPLVKINNTKSYGANIILHGELFDDANAHAQKLAKEKGYTYVHPFDDLDIATGQGTIAYEILQDLPDVHAILVPVGGGGLVAGVSQLVKLLNPSIKIIGVEPTGAASMKNSIAKKECSSLKEINTIAEGVAVKTPGKNIFSYASKNIDDIILIDDYELIDAFLDVSEGHKMIVENAGLLSIAALKHLDFEDKNVVCILSGGNMDVITMSSTVQHGLIRRGRIFTFSVLLPDKPGELLNIVEILSKERGNVIKLDHNQFVSLTRSESVELKVTIETFGKEHCDKIMKALKKGGFNPISVNTQ